MIMLDCTSMEERNVQRLYQICILENDMNLVNLFLHSLMVNNFFIQSASVMIRPTKIQICFPCNINTSDGPVVRWGQKEQRSSRGTPCPQPGDISNYLLRILKKKERSSLKMFFIQKNFFDLRFLEWFAIYHRWEKKNCFVGE